MEKYGREGVGKATSLAKEEGETLTSWNVVKLLVRKHRWERGD